MDANFIKGKTSVLAPAAELRTFFDSTADVDSATTAGNTDVSRPFELMLRYEDRLGKVIEEAFTIDMTERMGTLRTEVHGVHHIAKTLRAMAKKQGVTSF
jgi:hypothetical protein